MVGLCGNRHTRTQPWRQHNCNTPEPPKKQAFLAKCFYYAGPYDDPDAFATLDEMLQKHENGVSSCSFRFCLCAVACVVRAVCCCACSFCELLHVHVLRSSSLFTTSGRTLQPRLLHGPPARRVSPRCALHPTGSHVLHGYCGVARLCATLC
jgi:hypothetical protein